MKTVYVFLLLFGTNYAFSQFKEGRHIIYLTDKNVSHYSLSKPEEFLSSKAIHRRLLQGISIETSDLPVCASYVDEIKKCNASILYTSRWLNAIVCSIDTEENYLAIKNKPFVSQVQWLAPPHTPQDYVPSKIKEKKYSSDDENIYGDSYQQIAMNNGDFLHTKGYTGGGLTIAVLDAGFYAIDTEEKFQNATILKTKDFVHIGGDVYKKYSHGAGVLSLMCMNDKGFFYGSAPDASYILIRTEDRNSEYLIEEFNWIAGAEYADSCGADIINSSLGYNDFDDEKQNHSTDDLNGKTAPISIGARIATQKGIIVINSAGNDGEKDWKYICFPADAKEVLTVGAVDKRGNYSEYSSVGPTADNRIKPDVMAMGTNPLAFTKDLTFSTKSKGTSYAAPIITGLTACLWQAFPNVSNKEIVEIIKKSGQLYSNPNYQEGYGIANFKNAYEQLAILSDTIPFTVHVKPNPFYDSIVVNIEGISMLEPSITIKLLDALSKEIYVYTGTIKDFASLNHTIYTQNFDAGTYILTVQLQKYFSSKKVVLLR